MGSEEVLRHLAQVERMIERCERLMGIEKVKNVDSKESSEGGALSRLREKLRTRSSREVTYELTKKLLDIQHFVYLIEKQSGIPMFEVEWLRRG